MHVIILSPHKINENKVKNKTGGNALSLAIFFFVVNSTFDVN